MKVNKLKCEYITSPLGLDILKPQFSWQIESKEWGSKQTHYQLIVGELFGKNNIKIWDTGKVNSSKSAGVLYKGPDLKSRKKYCWQVKVWDNDKVVSSESDFAYFEMGLLNSTDWQASWIGSPANWSGRVLYFKRTFSVKNKIQQARAYISGLGNYVLNINGKRVGDHLLDPGTSDYGKRILYTTYDISNHLQEQNIVMVVVGPGWYGIPKLLMQIEILYENNQLQILPTEWNPYENWLVSTGPIVRSGIFEGELYDARQEKHLLESDKKINKDNRTSQWINAVITDSPGGKIVSQIQEPIKVTEILIPNKIFKIGKNIYVLDAGRNLSGWAAINVQGKRGTKVTLKFAESINADGSVNQENLRSAAAEDIYIFKGEGKEQWEPSFTYHGFRYIQVEGFPNEPMIEDILVKVVRSAVKSTGKFKCSNQLFNQIHQLVVNTEASNLHSIPTDCPQRDERMGWLNDMTVRIEQAIYNFNLSRFYIKWIDDIKDTQAEDGTITDTAPFRWGFRPADPVSASYLLLALKSYEFYGNVSIIEKHYQGFKNWVNYLNKGTENGIVNYSYWGDWSPPEKFGIPGSVGSGAVSKYTEGKLISTGYLCYCAKLVSQMATIIGKKEDILLYHELSEKTADAFNRKWWDKYLGGYGSNNQACNSFALFVGLADEEKKPKVIANLVQDIIKHDYHLTTGNLCTKYLLEVLTENGHSEIAYKIANQVTYPSWGYMIENGATTLWERWEKKTGGEMNSHNHPMMGSVGSWFYKYLVGIIPDINGPGFQRFTIKPYIMNELDYAEGEYQSIKGVIKCAWKKENDSLTLDLTIPGNSISTVFIPTKNKDSINMSNKLADNQKYLKFIKMQGNYAVFEVGSGSFSFTSNI